jgi:hypothetical protein
MGLDAIRHGILHEIIGKRGHKTIFLSGLEGGTLQVQILSRRALCLVSIVLWDVLWTAPHSYGVAAAQEEEINQVVQPLFHSVFFPGRLHAKRRTMKRKCFRTSLPQMIFHRSAFWSVSKILVVGSFWTPVDQVVARPTKPTNARESLVTEISPNCRFQCNRVLL